MMGPTHALGGAAALAAFSVVTGDERVSLLCFGVATASALIPDTDLPTSALSHFPLNIIKILAFPIWMNPFPRRVNGHTEHLAHRGRTHSIPALAEYVVLLWFYLWALGQLSVAVGHPLVLSSAITRALLAAGGIGYASHIGLDLLNISPGVQLLWPLPLRFVFPPFGRFGADSMRAHYLIHIPLTIFLVWYGFQYGGLIWTATHADPLIGGLSGIAFGVIGALIQFGLNILRSMSVSSLTSLSS